MKLSFINLCLLLMALSISACGKKAKEKDSSKVGQELQLTEDEGYILKDLKTVVLSNDIESLKKILSANGDIDLAQIIPGTGESLLTLAIINDFREIRNYLLERGADPSKQNALKQTPLFVAVKNNRLNSVAVLSELDINLNEIDFETKDTPLHRALRLGYKDIAELLVKAGANLEILDKDLKTPIRLAEEKGLISVSELIRSILQTEFGAPDLKSYKILIKEGDVPRLTSVLSRFPRIVNDYEMINPLVILVEGKDQFNSLKTAELLLKHQANVNGPLDAEQTPLIKATKDQKGIFANLFLSFKANPQLLDKDGKSALIHAIELNNLELVDLLLSYSAVEKYTFRKEGKKITYDSCKVARKVEEGLSDVAQKKANREIKKSLACGLSLWPF